MKGFGVAKLLAIGALLGSCKTATAPVGKANGGDAVPLAPRQATAIVAGAQHTCVLFNDGAVRCWGVGADGRLGSGSSASVGDTKTPRDGKDVGLGGKATALAAGAGHSCALLESGAVRCWGDGSFGQLGHGTKDDLGDDEEPATAGDVPLGERATAIAAGDKHSCALLASGTVRCWGSNDFRQLGTTARVGGSDQLGPIAAMTFDRPVLALAAYRASTCVVLDGGAVRCWGAVDGGWGKATIDVDLGTAASALAPGPGYGRGCAITASGAARCWGFALGIDLSGLGFPGETTVAPIPETGHPTVAEVGDLPIADKITRLGLSEHNACALRVDGTLVCWGDASEIFDDSWVLSDTVATAVQLGATPVAFAMGGNHVCVLLDTGGVRCWGRGAGGVLGQGNVDDVGPPRSPLPTIEVPM